MLWVLVLHVSALLLWCAALLSLPVLAAATLQRGAEPSLGRGPLVSLERFVFTHLATPAALVAIMAGTLVFLINRTVDGWLIAKLTLVTALVICHTLTGLLVLRIEGARQGEHTERWLPWWGRLQSVMTLVLIAVIIWLVLAKPTWDGLW